MEINDEVGEDRIILSLNDEHNEYNPSSYLAKQRAKCIYRFPHELKMMQGNNELYTTPLLASFGPYHHGKPHLQPMEQHKKRALYRILARTTGTTLESLVASLREHQQELMDSYDDLDPLWSPDSFVKMMLLDSCFMLELLRFKHEEEEDAADPVFSYHGWSHVFTLFRHDMLLLENQIPLLALKALLDAEGTVSVDRDFEINKLLLQFGGEDHGYNFPPRFHGLHALDVYRQYLSWTPSPNASPSEECSSGALSGLLSLPNNCIAYLCRKMLCLQEKVRFARSAKQLHDLGINFKASGNYDLEIEFDERNGVLTLPFIGIDGSSGFWFRNLMAFERMHPPAGNKVTSFVGFMGCIVDTAEDVSFLRLRGVLRHFLGSDEDAAMIFNTVVNGIVTTEEDENSKIYSKIRDYAGTSLHGWRANLVHRYFSNPWTCLSLFAGALLLILTIIQTVFSVLAFYRKSS